MSQKGHKPTATSEVPGAKAGYYAWSLYTATPWGRQASWATPSSAQPQAAPILTPCEEPACSPRRASKGEQARVPSFLSSLPRAAAQVPGKPFLNFFLKDACKNHAYILEKVAQQYVLKIKSENIFLQDDKYRVLIQDGDIGRSWIHLPQKFNRQLYMEQFHPEKKPPKYLSKSGKQEENDI